MKRVQGVSYAPSYEEGFNIAVCEAMACGMPAVAYCVARLPRAVWGGAYACSPTGDTDAMAREIVKLLTDQKHYGERAAAATQGRATVRLGVVSPATALAAIDSKTVSSVVRARTRRMSTSQHTWLGTGSGELLSKVGDMSFRRRVLTVCEYLDPTPCDLILDAGCGEGFISIVLEHVYGCRVVGLDVLWISISWA